MFDVLIQGGRVVDGTGAPPYPADVGVRDGRIEAVGDLTSGGARPAAVAVEATGRLVLPGFVDAHVHGDATVLDPGVQLAALRQGVTTFVLGQDGLSFAPSGPETLRFVTRYFAAINGAHPALDGGPVSVADLLATYDRTTALNTAYLVPHGTVRHAASADPAQMLRLVERGLEDGAAGLSSGLEYVPGRYGDAAELAALCAPVARAGLPYVTHMRGYEEAAATGMAEARAIAERAGVALHVSHYHGPGERLAGMVDRALAAGLDVTFDSYPYRSGFSILAMVALPRDLDGPDGPDGLREPGAPGVPAPGTDGGTAGSPGSAAPGGAPGAPGGGTARPDLDRTVALLHDPAVRRRLARETDPALWRRIVLAHVPSPGLAWTEGRTLADAAAEAGRDPAGFCADLLIATGLAASCVFAQPPGNDDASLRLLLRHPAHLGGSDAIHLGGHPHPRAFGAFARFLGRHVRELGDWTWQEAVAHLSSGPARRFRLPDRGQVRPGMAADLVVVDPERVTDTADYLRPRVLAEGIDDVLVGGVPVLAGGALTGARPGRPLRPR
ncbi:amidohydrolase family protein [Planomonospora sp. ID82291]|uniref:N-acyl-D-amino-acid deacylase family protein n=1 Tax=Planomonospora sp. ID82291 TaxID=2738136 RepID=UPI0018C438C2|nr:amidohydrolase family protein [Planomonospora sp. ID82291]MBG0816971.1 amidohydrolase family protein [Planomonospora sp. ID82291]